MTLGGPRTRLKWNFATLERPNTFTTELHHRFIEHDLGIQLQIQAAFKSGNDDMNDLTTNRLKALVNGIHNSRSSNIAAVTGPRFASHR